MSDPKWRIFACEDCGEVEEIDVSEDALPQICNCGAEMDFITIFEVWNITRPFAHVATNKKFATREEAERWIADHCEAPQAIYPEELRMKYEVRAA